MLKAIAPTLGRSGFPKGPEEKLRLTLIPLLDHAAREEGVDWTIQDAPPGRFGQLFDVDLRVMTGGRSRRELTGAEFAACVEEANALHAVHCHPGPDARRGALIRLPPPSGARPRGAAPSSNGTCDYLAWARLAGRVRWAGPRTPLTALARHVFLEATVPGYKVEQRHLMLGERSFHFVSYEGRPANARRGEDAEGPMWCLMSEGRRRPVMPHTPGQALDELDRQLLEWLRQQL